MGHVSRSSGEDTPERAIRIAARGQVDPVPALVAVVAVAAGVGLYAAALDGVPTATSTDRAPVLLERIHDETVDGGVADPDRLDVPSNRTDPRVAVVLSTSESTWRVGTELDRTDPGTTTASRRVSVRTAPGNNDPGTLRVVVG